MFEALREDKKSQLVLGLLMGIAFGFFLQTGGVTDYNVIIAQLLLTDFTVFKVMLSAVLVGMLGIWLMKSKGLVSLHVKSGSVGSTVIGGLIFGAGFAILGYCPGTVAGAVGQGAMDALFGGVVGLIIGSAVFAAVYPALESKVMPIGQFGAETIPELLRVRPVFVIIPLSVLIVAVFWGLETIGL